MTEGRWIDLSVEVPGTPEEVWDTIATGPGITSWFVPMDVDGRVGGEVVMDFGDYGKESATVTAWDPPRRLVYESGGDRALAYEWLVEARDGGSCVVRLVNTGFGPGEDWDADFDGMSSGWRIFLRHLALQLTYFPGRRARAITPTVMVPGPNAAAWRTVCTALGIGDDLPAGTPFRTGPDAPPLSGTVESAGTSDMAREYLLRLDGPAPGTGFLAAEGKGDQVACSLYLYVYAPDTDPLDDVWTPWLRSHWPAPDVEATAGATAGDAG